MPKKRRTSAAKNRDPKTVAFWSFIAAALVLGSVLYVASESRTPDAVASEAYIPTETLKPPAAALRIVRPTDRPLGVQFIGDSVTVGSGASVEASNFRAQVEDRLRAGGPIESSVSATGGARLQKVADETTVMPGAGLVFIELGTNDSDVTRDPTPLDVFTTQYDALIGKVRAAAPDAQLVCMGMWRPNTPQYDGIVRDRCTAAQGRYVPLDDVFTAEVNRGPEGRPVFGSNTGVGDNFHPNDAGYAAITGRIFENISNGADPSTTGIAAANNVLRDNQRPVTLGVIGDSTGANANSWVFQTGVAMGIAYDRPVDIRSWSNDSSSYGDAVRVREGKGKALTIFNGSAAGKNADYSIANLAVMAPKDVAFDAFIINHGHNEDLTKPLAPQIMPLVGTLRQTWPTAAMVVIEQNQRAGQGDTWAKSVREYASAMQIAGYDVIDVFTPFASNVDLKSLMRDDVHPNDAGQSLWSATVRRAFGI